MITTVFPTICAESVAEAAGFYRSLFGFVDVFVTEWYVQLEAPGRPSVQLGIVDRSHTSIPAGHSQRPAGVLIGIEVDDVDALYARATTAGREIVMALRDEPWGQRHFMTLDPAGTLVDVITPIAPSSPEHAASYRDEAHG